MHLEKNDSQSRKISYIQHHEEYTTSTQTKPKPCVNGEITPPLQDDESFTYLGRYFNFSLNNQKYKAELLDTRTASLNNINKLPFYPNSKLNLYNKVPSKQIIMAFKIAEIPETWVKENLDSSFLRSLDHGQKH